MSRAPLDKETLKELRGKLLAQEKEQSRLRNSKESRQEMYRKRDTGEKTSKQNREEQTTSMEEDEEMEMEM